MLHNLKTEDLLKSRNIFVAIEQESKQAKQDGADLPANYDEMLTHLADIRNAMGPSRRRCSVTEIYTVEIHPTS